ncbi:MAG: helix-turn-helix transcriptional regulator [Bacillota bacterium]
MITYKPLLKMLVDKNMNKMDLKTIIGLSSGTVAKLSKNEYVSLEVIERLCAYFQCQPSDIFEYVSDDK